MKAQFESEKDSIIHKQCKRVENAVAELSVDFYNISPIFHKMNIKPSCDLGSYACVDENGRGLFNPFMMANISDEDIKFIVMHEAFHVLLKHVGRYKKICKDFNYFAYWNYATDAFINENLFKTFNSKIEGIVDYSVVATMAGIDRNDVCNHSSESLFELIVEHQKELQEEQKGSESGSSSSTGSSNGNSQGDSQNNSGGSSGSGDQQQTGDNNGAMNNKSFGDKTSVDSSGGVGGEDNNPCVNDQSTIEAVKKYFEDMDREEDNKDFFDDYSNNTRIYDPNTDQDVTNKNDEEIIRDIVEKNLNWKKALDNFVTEVSGKHDVVKSWRRPNRKYRDYYPMSKGRVRRGHKKFVFSVDVSGSMDNEKINAVVAIINNYVKKVRVDCEYYFFNSHRHANIKFKNIEKFTADYFKVNGGGTNFHAAIDCGDVDGVVIISDMEFNADANINDLDSKNIPYKFIDIYPNGRGKHPAVVNNENYVPVY